MATHVVVNDDELLEFFSKLGEGDLTDEIIYQEAERFVCKMYGSKTITSVNQLRSKLFGTRLRKNDRVPDYVPDTRLVHIMSQRCGGVRALQSNRWIDMTVMDGYLMEALIGSTRYFLQTLKRYFVAKNRRTLMIRKM